MLDEADVRAALRHVLDPELGINIVDLGLVYRIDVDEPRVRVVMTMTSRRARWRTISRISSPPRFTSASPASPTWTSSSSGTRRGIRA